MLTGKGPYAPLEFVSDIIPIKLFSLVFYVILLLIHVILFFDLVVIYIYYFVRATFYFGCFI